jgi:serine/threonine-protein kinase
VAAAAGTPPPPPTDEETPSERGFFTPARIAILGALLVAVAAALVYFLVLDGGGEVLVPTVINKTQAEAEVILGDAGFEVAVRSVPNDAPAQTVLEQDPLAGHSADKGSTVTITVSSGLGTVVVPPVAGQSKKQATKALRDLGLRPKQRNVPSSTVKAGLAIGTVPAAGSELARGKRIELDISSGPKAVLVPSVIGSQQDAADTQIRDAGLIPDFENRDSDAPAGQVIAQDPSAGTSVSKHTAVTVVVSNGPAPSVVPNVVGESQDAAKGDLKAAGLNVRIVKRTTTDPNEDRQVLDQSPSAGTRLSRGEFVTVFVGEFTSPPTTTTTPTTPTTPAP